MIAACPKCSARYRVDPQRLGADGARLKCAKCAAVFRVRAPVSASAPAQATPPQGPFPARVEAPAVNAAVAAAAAAPPSLDSARLVVVADSEIESGKQTAAAIHEWGLQAVLVHDGVEAMLAIQRLLPTAVVLDAGLSKMYGFQVCEVIKRNESLKGTTVALVGAIHQQDRYRRPPSDLYGADVYLERPDLPFGLRPILEAAGMTLNRVESAGLPQSNVAAKPVSVPPQPSTMGFPSVAAVERTAPVAPVAAEAPAARIAQPGIVQREVAADDGLAADREKAERLARIIVSDIVLYNAEKFEAALAAGNVVAALEGDLVEGRALFEQRIDPRVRSERDHLMDELRRVASERGGR